MIARGLIPLALAACGGAAQPGAVPAPAPPARTEVAANAVSARIAIGRGGELPDNWVDVVASGDDAAAQCAAAVAAALAETYPAKLAIAPAVARACERTPLPPPPAALGDARVLAMSRPPAPDLLGGASSDADVVQFTAFATPAECARVRDRIAAEQRRAATDAARSQSDWLGAERDRARADSERDCVAADQVRARCAAITDPIDRGPCDVELDRAARACTVARDRLALIEERLADPPPPDPMPAPRCR